SQFQDMAGAKQTNYQYVKLHEAKSGGSAKSYNVFGVVTFSKVPKKTQGTDYCMTVSITDESLPPGEKIVCMLFYRTLDSFPVVSVGDVVRFHRLVVEDFHGEPKGKPGYGFSWLVVGNDVEKPWASSQRFTYTDDNKKRVKELKEWAESRGLVRNSSQATIASLTPRSYCDLYCQVIGTCVEEEDVCFVARVWDGTRPLHPTVNTLNRLEHVDTELDRVTSEMSVDIWLYDDHFQICRRIKPGQFVKLCNLHAVVHKESAAENPDGDVAFPTLELTIHRGTSYGRGVVLVDAESPEVTALKQRIASMPVSSTAVGPSAVVHQHRSEPNLAPTQVERVDLTEPQPGCSHEKTPGQHSPSNCSGNSSELGGGPLPHSEDEQRNVQPNVVSGSKNNLLATGGGDGTVSQPSSAEECHQHISRTPLSQVLSHSVPYKFRVLANVVDFHPNVDDASQFVQFVCPKCCQFKLASFLGGRFANWNPEQEPHSSDTNICQQCSTDEDPVPLEPTYMLRLILQDSSGHLVANLWRKEAVTFFRGIRAEDLLKEKGIFSDIMFTLRSLCLSCGSLAASPPPKLDCCLHSYNAQSGVNFHIFDTELV
ncbi:hypothetical protein BaRGS_00032727, partial [Batillaria attramentaria]